MKIMKYENGLEVLFYPDKTSQIASVNIVVNVGAVNEAPEHSGLSHFIEHLLFKGSKHYAGDYFSRAVESVGGYVNAQTSKEMTMYYANIPSDFAAKTLKILADMMINPVFDKQGVDTERLVVIEEIQRCLDDPRDVLYEAFFKAVYKHSANANTIIGTKDIIANISIDEIAAYHKNHYTAKNIIVSIGGNFDEGEMKKIIDATFAKMPQDDFNEKLNVSEKSHECTAISLKGNVMLPYMMTGFLGPDICSDELFVGQLGAIILGGSRSSRLVRVLKDQKQLVYTISSGLYCSKGTTVFSNFAISKFDNLDDINYELNKQIEAIKADSVSNEELERAKILERSAWIFGHERPEDIAQSNAYWHLIGRPDCVNNYLDIVNKISSKDICDFFNKYYDKEYITNVSLTPSENGGEL
jgi:zinc protease